MGGGVGKILYRKRVLKASKRSVGVKIANVCGKLLQNFRAKD
jgi:hypothetical protein